MIPLIVCMYAERVAVVSQLVLSEAFGGDGLQQVTITAVKGGMVPRTNHAIAAAQPCPKIRACMRAFAIKGVIAVVITGD